MRASIAAFTRFDKIAEQLTTENVRMQNTLIAAKTNLVENFLFTNLPKNWEWVSDSKFEIANASLFATWFTFFETFEVVYLFVLSDLRTNSLRINMSITAGHDYRPYLPSDPVRALLLKPFGPATGRDVVCVPT
jgi:hypothetical protein